MSKHCKAYSFNKNSQMKDHKNAKTVSKFCSICGLYKPSGFAEDLVVYRPSQFPKTEIFRLNPQTILKEMISKQHKNRCFNTDPNHADFRGQLVKWLIGISDKLDFNKDALHLSISILDSILSVFAIQEDQVKVFTFVSLYMAAKMEEKKHKLPTLDSVIELFEDEFSADEFKYYETVVLVSLNFDLNIITPFKFVSYFCYRGALFNTDFEFKIKPGQVELIKEGFSHFCEVFLKACLMSYETNRYSPLIVGCSVIACARKYLNCKKVWPVILQELTGVDETRLKGCSEILERSGLKHFEDDLDEFFTVFNRRDFNSRGLLCQMNNDCSINEGDKCFDRTKRARFISEDNISTTHEFSPDIRSISFS